MFRTFTLAAILCFVSGNAFPQTQGTKLRFEAASFKLSPLNGRRSDHRDPGRIDFQSITLQGLLWEAYHIWYYQILWPQGRRSAEKYDITATIPANASRQQVREMLQALLAERLKLKVHWESKELSVYALTIAKSGCDCTKPLSIQTLIRRPFR